jgi:RNA polymerase-binding transcription factor DksA
VVAKVAAKKVAPKAPAKKVIAKVVAKKVAPKAPAKKVVAKVIAKKVIAKVVAKKVVAKVVAKVAAKKVIGKPAVKKVVAPVVVAKPVVVKPIAKKPVEIKKPEPVNIVIPRVQDPNEKSRYSDSELIEFKEIITKKLTSAREELQLLTETLSNPNNNGTDDTAGTFKVLEDGSATLEKEHVNQLAVRQRKFIDQLEAALIRIKNKTYGICRETGKIIPKERLRAVPHTTLSMEAKLKQN